MANDLIRLALYETKDVVPVQSFAPGTHTFPLHTEGNSLLSTVWVKSAGGGSVQVKYWDFGPGGADFPGERIDLRSHIVISSDDTSDRMIVTTLHNKPRVEIIVTGGTVQLGVYVTVVATFASDLDSSLKLDGEVVDLAHDKGLPIMGLDENGVFHFLPLKNGHVQVSSEPEGAPGRLGSADGLTTTQNATINAIPNQTVPVGKEWYLRSIVGACRAIGFFEIFVNNTKLSGIRLISGPASENPKHKCDPYIKLTAGQTLAVKYSQSAGPVCDIAATVYYTEVDI